MLHRKRGEEGEGRVIMYMRKENLCRLNWERFYVKRGNIKGVKLRTFCAISTIDNRKYLPQLSAANCNIYKCICCMNASEKIRERERERETDRESDKSTEIK